MHVKKIILASTTGTSMMTLFSYVVSRSKREQFREPQLLSILLKRMISPKGTPANTIGGWSLHYGVGTLFATLYDFLWSKRIVGPSFKNAALLGAASGLVGISGWHMVLKVHPNPPKVNLEKYYGHLFAAHIVFGVSAWMGYKIPRENSKQLDQNSDHHNTEEQSIDKRQHHKETPGVTHA